MSTSPVSNSKILNSLKDGFCVFAASAIPVNGFNGISVVSCRHNCSTIKAAMLIYQGKIYNCPPSVTNFTIGLRPFLAKETLRLGSKTGGLSHLKPYLENEFRGDPYGALKISSIFSGVLATFEMGIQPIDTWYTQDQSGKRRSKFREAYIGATANGLRQFKTWMAFSYAEAYFSRLLREQTNINPSSTNGIIVNAFPVGFSVTLLCHLEQRSKNFLQSNEEAAKRAKARGESRYVRAFREIIKEQGVNGICRGLAAKSISNIILSGGALFLLEKGRANLIKRD